ncbi:hypothetical protein SALBM217S_05103 [Streptomyces griseoloalbus]
MRTVRGVLPCGVLVAVDPRTRPCGRAADAARRRRRGRRQFFGVVRDDMADPDGGSGTPRPAPAALEHAFDVPDRDEETVGDIKQIWEPSRHQT